MNKASQQIVLKTLGWILILSIFIFGWFIQQRGLFSYDVSWLMHASRRFIHGGNYYNNFVEPNPPLILYLYSLPVLVAHFFHLSFITTSRFFTFFIATISLAIAYPLLKKILRDQTRVFLSTLILAMIFVLLPAYEFGQREHLTLMLTIPYFLLEVLQANQTKLNPWLKILIGLLAGIGFSMKPFFLFIPFLTELFLCLKQKNIWFVFRLENFVIFIFVIAYALTIILMTPQYIHTIIPLALHFYSTAYQMPFVDLLLQPCILLIIGTFVVYAVMRNIFENKTLGDILCISSFGFMVIYFIEGGLWYYHIIPAFGLACLLMTFCVFYLSKQWAILLLILVSIIPISIVYQLDQTGIVFKNQKTFHQMITIINQQANHQSVEVLSDSITGIYPWIDYTHAYSASRFGSLWILPGILQGPNNRYNRSAKKFVLQSVTEDIAQYHPRLLFVDVAKIKAHIQQPNFDYIQYFSQNPLFKKEFKHYHFLEKIGCYNVYKYSLTTK